MNERAIQITQADMEKLKRMIEARRNASTREQENLAMLANELERAEIVPAAEISSEAVTMHSQVLVRDLNTGSEATYTVVFPTDADITQGKVSVLAPVGTALLGYRKGDEIDWPTPGGRRRLKIVQVLYQPEAAGDEPGHAVARSRPQQMPDGGSRGSQVFVS